jgi:hypothetical protein
LVLGLLLAVVGLGLGQPQTGTDKKEPPGAPTGSAPTKTEKPVTPSLEELIANALRNNPDIRVHEAKVREAEAELNRIRIQVLQKVIAVSQSVEAQKESVQDAEVQYSRLKTLYEAGRSPIESFAQARSALALEKSKLATAEAELPTLIGKLPAGLAGLAPSYHADAWQSAIPSRSGPWDRVQVTPFAESLAGLYWHAKAKTDVAQPTPGPLVDRIRQALDKPISLKAHNATLGDVLKLLQQQFPGISFHGVVPSRPPNPVIFDAAAKEGEPKVNIDLENVPLGAVLQALEDSFPEIGGRSNNRLRLAVRDYGILVTCELMLPAGATLLHDFWKGRAGGEAKTAPAVDGVTRNPPPHNVEGVIQSVDQQSNLVTISIGSDAGLQKGHTLEVYRLKPEPRYLGTVQIVELKPNLSVAKSVGRSRGQIQIGDRVGSLNTP